MERMSRGHQDLGVRCGLGCGTWAVRSPRALGVWIRAMMLVGTGSGAGGGEGRGAAVRGREWPRALSSRKRPRVFLRRLAVLIGVSHRRPGRLDDETDTGPLSAVPSRRTVAVVSLLFYTSIRRSPPPRAECASAATHPAMPEAGL
jgi:hypothetical protein